MPVCWLVRSLPLLLEDYPFESYKREAVAKAEASGNVSQTARELGISNTSLQAWIKQYGEALDVETASVKER
jgi:transposase-like protein